LAKGKLTLYSIVRIYDKRNEKVIVKYLFYNTGTFP